MHVKNPSMNIFIFEHFNKHVRDLLFYQQVDVSYLSARRHFVNVQKFESKSFIAAVNLQEGK
jgi:hypothetical protein